MLSPLLAGSKRSMNIYEDVLRGHFSSLNMVLFWAAGRIARLTVQNVPLAVIVHT